MHEMSRIVVYPKMMVIITRVPKCKNVVMLPAAHQPTLLVTLITKVDELPVPARSEHPTNG